METIIEKVPVRRRRASVSESEQRAIVEDRISTGKTVSEISKKWNIAPAAFYRYNRKYREHAQSAVGETASLEYSHILSLERENEKLKKFILDVLIDRLSPSGKA